MGGRRADRDVDRPAQALVPQGLGQVRSRRRLPRLLDPEPYCARGRRHTGRDVRGNVGGVPAFAAPRSSIGGLAHITTPVFMVQGRRDFAFGIDQVRRAFGLLAGPKGLWIGQPRPCAVDRSRLRTRRQCSPRASAGSTATCAESSPAPTRPNRWLRRATSVGARGPTAHAAAKDATQHVVPDGTRSVAASRKCPYARHEARSWPHSRSSARRRSVSPIAASGGWSRLVAVLTRAHERRRGNRRRRRRRPAKPGAAAVTDPAGRPGDVRPEGLAPRPHARVVLDGADRARTSSTSTSRWPRARGHASAPPSLKLPGLRTPVTK